MTDQNVQCNTLSVTDGATLELDPAGDGEVDGLDIHATSYSGVGQSDDRAISANLVLEDSEQTYTFNECEISDVMYLYIDGDYGSFEFNDCELENSEKGIALKKDDESNGVVVFNDCLFTSNGTSVGVSTPQVTFNSCDLGVSGAPQFAHRVGASMCHTPQARFNGCGFYGNEYGLMAQYSNIEEGGYFNDEGEFIDLAR